MHVLSNGIGSSGLKGHDNTFVLLKYVFYNIDKNSISVHNLLPDIVAMDWAIH